MESFFSSPQRIASLKRKCPPPLNDRKRQFLQPDKEKTSIKIIGECGLNPTCFHYPHNVALDRYGNMFIADSGNNQIRILDRHGQFPSDLSFFVGTLMRENTTAEGEFDYPTGVAVDSQRHLIVADMNNHRIQVFQLSPASRDERTLRQRDQTFQFLRSFGQKGSKTGQFLYPTSVAVDAFDNILVVDHQNNRIQVFNSNGIFLHSFGQKGCGDGEFSGPSAIAINSNGHILVSDTFNNRIQIFDASRKFLVKFGQKGYGDGDFHRPDGITIDPHNNDIIVVDHGNNRIQIFDAAGKFLSKFGQIGYEPGKFLYPNGIAIASGRLIVVDTYNHRIQII